MIASSWVCFQKVMKFSSSPSDNGRTSVAAFSGLQRLRPAEGPVITALPGGRSPTLCALAPTLASNGTDCYVGSSTWHDAGAIESMFARWQYGWKEMWTRRSV